MDSVVAGWCAKVLLFVCLLLWVVSWCVKFQVTANAPVVFVQSWMTCSGCYDSILARESKNSQSSVADRVLLFICSNNDFCLHISQAIPPNIRSANREEAAICYYLLTRVFYNGLFGFLLFLCGLSSWKGKCFTFFQLSFFITSLSLCVLFKSHVCVCLLLFTSIFHLVSQATPQTTSFFFFSNGNSCYTNRYDRYVRCFLSNC